MFPDLDLGGIFSFHPADTDEKRELHETVRDKCLVVADWMQSNLPACPERTLAIRKVQEAMMFANSAVAQYKKD